MANYFQAAEKPIYGNRAVYAPNGILMFYGTDKKANWYLSRNLAELHPTEPNGIILTFQPKGFGNQQDLFSLSPKENKCVCCGTEENLSQHHIIPIVYKKHFPLDIKSHDCHDVVILCVSCHRRYEGVAFTFKGHLLTYYGMSANVNLIKHYTKAVKAAKTLKKHFAGLPLAIKEKLFGRISYYTNKAKVEDLTEEDLTQITKGLHELLEQVEYNGKHLIESFTATEQFQEFAETWREHFLKTMQPKFMPLHWDKNRPINYKSKQRQNERDNIQSV